MKLPRANDWPERLFAFIETRRHMPFQWGTNDCGIFCADGILGMSGVDLGAKFRGYISEGGAYRKVKKAGGMEGLAAALIAKHKGLAQRGDVILANVEHRETYGLVSASGLWCAPGAAGLVFRPIEGDAIKVFEF